MERTKEREIEVHKSFRFSSKTNSIIFSNFTRSRMRPSSWAKTSANITCLCHLILHFFLRLASFPVVLTSLFLVLPKLCSFSESLTVALHACLFLFLNHVFFLSSLSLFLFVFLFKFLLLSVSLYFSPPFFVAPT